MKNIFVITAILSLAMSATAQDTVSLLTRHANYFYQDGFHPDSTCVPMVTTGHGGNRGGEMAKEFVTKDTLKVIGIAAALWKNTKSTYDLDHILDTSHESANSYLRLYTPDHDTGVVQREALFNIFYTPVSYYYWNDVLSIYDPLVRPVYELMFDRPIIVFDTFYVGKTSFGALPSGAHPDGDWYDAHIDYFLGVMSSPCIPYNEITLNRFVRQDGSTSSWRRDSDAQQYLLIWPILDTVNPTDTSGTSDDTLAIGEPELLHRLTSVTPNPATGRAKVVSSFGLTMVEAFNTAGEKVHELRLPDTPFSATLDVSRWPAGTYILRLHTPQGVATKKLVVK